MADPNGREFMAFLAMAMSAAAEDYKEKLTGAHGPKGEDSTVPGPIGPMGPRGLTGQMGQIGPKGDKGDQGAEGPRGLDGYGGKDGRDGKDGKDGVEFVLTDDVLTYGGFWKFGVDYRKGSLVAHAGDIWYRMEKGADGKPGKSNHWMLFLKSGAGRLSGYGVVQGQGGSGGITSLTVGTTPVTAGNANRLFYETSANVLGEIAALNATSVLFADSNGLPTSSSLFTWKTSGAAGEGLSMAAGTATTAVSAFSATQTWNNAGVTFTHDKRVITTTASAAASLLLDYWAGSSGSEATVFNVRKDGQAAFGPVGRKNVIIGNDGNDGMLQTTTSASGGFWFTLYHQGASPLVLCSINTGVTTVSDSPASTGNNSVCFDVNVGASPGAQNTVFDNAGTRRTGLAITQYSGNSYLAFPCRPAFDEAKGDFYITGAPAKTSATVNLTGGNIRVFPGDGASGSAGAATGGSLYLDGGRGYGTGVHGNIRIGATRGVLIIDKGYTVATLPAGILGMHARVTDALAPAVGVLVAAGGAAAAAVWYNGAQWTVYGI